MNYKYIENDDDIKELMNHFNFFHDSCIKEIKYESGSYVDRHGAMYPFADKKCAAIFFQSQSAVYRVIELRFEGLIHLNLLPRKENYDNIIFEASLIKREGVYYWSEWRGFSPDDDNDTFGTWLSAEKVSWKSLPDTFLGSDEFYAAPIKTEK